MTHPLLTTDQYSHNLERLLKPPEDRLEVKNGRLSVVVCPKNGSQAFPFFSLFRSDTHEKELAEVVNRTCQQFFSEIISSHPDPLTSKSPTLIQERERVNTLIKNIERVNSKLLSPQLSEDLKELVESPETLEARLALRIGIAPKVLNQTISGTYIMHNRLKKPWGIFKPKRQEVGGDKNPSWLVWLAYSAENWGIESGTGYLRESAAYRLDHHHFAKVPLTTTTHFAHTNLDTSIFRLGNAPDLVGSFQLFKPHCKQGGAVLHMYEYLPSGDIPLMPRCLSSLLKRIYATTFRAFFFLGLNHIPINDLHKMAILDIRLLNCDRHLGNFLIDNHSQLYPIDHGLVLPANANFIRFEWKDLIQTYFPFSQEVLKYITELDPEKDAEILKQAGITSQSVLERMKLSTRLLQTCAAKGMALHEIADLMHGKNTPQGVRETYFEKEICQKVLIGGQNADDVISQAIRSKDES